MQTFISVVHALVTLALVAVILLQRSEGGGLVADNSNLTGFAGSRAVANFFTKLTTTLAIAFFVLSISLSIIAKNKLQQETGILPQQQNQRPANLEELIQKQPIQNPQVPRTR